MEVRQLALFPKHAAVVCGLPRLHHNPLEWLLVTQVEVDGLTLAAIDVIMSRYGTVGVKLVKLGSELASYGVSELASQEVSMIASQRVSESASQQVGGLASAGRCFRSFAAAEELFRAGWKRVTKMAVLVRID